MIFNTEINSLTKQVEFFNNFFHIILVDEREVSEMVKYLPGEVEDLEKKIESADHLFSHSSCAQ